MSVELKLFGGRFEPQKGALKKDSTLPVYVSFVRTKNKSNAKTLLQAEFIKFIHDRYDDYFAPKIWEAVEGMFCTVEGQFYTDAFTGDIVWNAEKGEPERVESKPEAELEDHTEDFQQEDLPPAEKMTLVKDLDSLARAYCLVMFGPVEEVSASQYGQMIDLYNDDVSNPLREQAEGISKEPRILALHPDKQVECLAWVRQEVRDGAKWPDYKNLLTKWLDTPPAQRKPAKTDNNANERLSISDLQQRNTQLRYRIALGVISRSMDFDINSTPMGIELRANSMLSDKNETDITDWFLIFSRTPGVYDFHPAAIIAMIKTAEDKLSHYPGELRKYIDKCISDFDCINPTQLIIDIACGHSSAPLPQKTEENKIDDQTGQTVSGETEVPAVCPARAAELDRELDAAFSQPANDEELRHKTDLMLAQQRGECIPELGDDPTDPKWDSMAGAASNEVEKQEAEPVIDDWTPISEREIEIAHALNDLVSGRTDIMSKKEAESVVVCTGHLIADVLPLIIIDIATTEFCLSPIFSDEEIHDVATTILDGWSDDAAVRQKNALDAIVEYRRPEPPKPVVIDPPTVTVKPKKEPESIPAATAEPMALTYRQQLTLAALQGMCANPAYRGDFDDLPMMAAALASGVIDMESAQ